jgi:hypothetical protein
MAAERSDPFGPVRERIEGQAHGHWHEFSVIVASANVLLALVLYGRILTTAHANQVTFFAVAIALASTLAAMFAYYSIQIGILLVFGPLRLAEVVVSFMIAGVQLALFLWPTHVLGQQWNSAGAELRSLRQWLGFFALFAFAGPLANWYAARARRLRRPELMIPRFERRQLIDRVAGFISCGLVAGCWIGSFRCLTPALIVGLVVAVGGLAIGTADQAYVARLVHKWCAAP